MKGKRGKSEKNINKTGNETFCKLCDNIVNDESFTIIENTIKEVLDVLLLKLNVKEVNTLIMCNACSINSFAAFNFKATCTDTEDCIFPYINSEREAPVDLRDVYLKERGKEHLKDILEDERICRLCLQVVTCEFTLVEKVNVDTLGEYIPEVDFSSTKEPVICKICFDSLYTHTNFLKKCLSAQTKINICEDESTEGSFHIITEIELKSEESYSESGFPSEDKFLDYSSECQSGYAALTNNSTSGHKTKRHGPKLGNKPIYRCDYCNFETYWPGSFRHHRLRHKVIPEEQMFKCDLCDYKTIYMSCFRPHRRTHEYVPEEQMYECHSCGYKTRKKQHLTQHMATHKVGPEEQMYTCDSCDYKTAQKRLLTSHQRIHKDMSEARVHKCDSCDFKTVYRGSLIHHRLTHMDVPDEQMHKCDLCDFKTVHKSTLVRHQRSHKNIPEEQIYKCDVCNFKSMFKYTLTQHQLKHADIPIEQMYRCNSCEYRIINKKLLASHMQRHKTVPREKMLKCDLCDFKTRLQQYLTKHQLLRHRDIPEEEMFRCYSCDYKTRETKTSHHTSTETQSSKGRYRGNTRKPTQLKMSKFYKRTL